MSGMKKIILLGCLILALFCILEAKPIKRVSRGNLKSRQNHAELVKQFSALPPEIQQKVIKTFNQMKKSGKLPNLQGATSNQNPYNSHRKSPYQLRDEAFYGGNAGAMQQQPMIAGPDPFYAMRGLEMDTTKLNKIFDKWEEEAAEKAAAEKAAAEAQSGGGGGGGGGLDGLGDVVGLAVKFAPMLMAFG